MKDDQFKNLKKELDREIFSKVPVKSKKREILYQIKMKKETKRIQMKKWIYPTAIAAAVFLVFLVSYPLITQQNLKNDSGDSATSAKVNKNENEIAYTLEGIEGPNDSHKQNQQTAQTEPKEKSAEEWRLHFKNLWAQEDRVFDNLHLKYTTNFSYLNKNDARHSYIIDSEMKDGKLVYNYRDFANPDFTKISERLIFKNGTQYLLDHNQKRYEKQGVTGGNMNTLNKYHRLTLLPIFPNTISHYSLADNYYKWTIEQTNTKEQWIEIRGELSGPIPAKAYRDPDIDRFKAKIDTENGIILSLKGYDLTDTLVSDIEVTELAANEQADKYKPDVEFPADYVNLEDIIKNRVPFDEEWVKAAEAEAKKNPDVAEFFYSGEGGILYFVLEFKDGADVPNSRATAEKFIETFTKTANHSKEYQDRAISVWDDHQYKFTIRLDIGSKSYEGNEGTNRNNSIPDINWQPATKRVGS
ncbi:hypothetical protein [Falsibacillus pallidus]|uniref:Uncharacterized protein n=1 Tax=Falsibacillus pallidus TaxID=493781 RepID=A0A370GCS7_9BACI|nr:hypothetical protein [Falsibacillus pallidus]RDI41642.1 hypothetical protein DFR59_10796 [Falsibacillus pallidus]